MDINLNELKKIIDENSKLKTELSNLKKHQNEINIWLDKIYNAKSYKIWQKFNDIKKMIKNPKYIIYNLIPFEYKHKIKNFIKHFEEIKNKKELKKYFEYVGKLDYSKQKIQEIDKVSVIIPTLNAGEMWEIVLKKIISQKHIKEIEIIVADSGSTDNTLSIAKKYGVKIIYIKKGFFSHSKTRNEGAKIATGKYIVFTVQDAYFLNQYSIYDAINLMEQNKSKVCTGRQIARSDADIFSSWQTIHFSNFLSPEHKNRIIKIEKKSFEKLDNTTKRSFCTIDDVFSVYKKDFFDSIGGYNESYDYGEDLEMGKRIIKSGNSLTYLYTNGVIHSHVRSASHFIKRFYVDSLFLNKVFPKKNINYQFSNLKISNLISILYELERLNIKKETNISNISSSLDSLIFLKKLTKINTSSKEFIINYPKMKIEFNLYIDNTIQQIKNMGYLSGINSEEYATLLDKVFSIYASSQLSQYYLSQKKLDKETLKIDQILKGEI